MITDLDQKIFLDILNFLKCNWKKTTVILIFLIGWNVWWVAAGNIIRRSPLCPWLLPFLLERRFLKTDEQLILIICSWFITIISVSMCILLTANYLNKQLHHYPFTDWTLFCVCTTSEPCTVLCCAVLHNPDWGTDSPVLQDSPLRLSSVLASPLPPLVPLPDRLLIRGWLLTVRRWGTLLVSVKEVRAGILKLQWQNTSSSHQLRARTSIYTHSTSQKWVHPSHL